MEAVANSLKLPPSEVREVNFMVSGERTAYG